MSSIYVK